MLTKTDLGGRIRAVRKERSLTLKQLEKTSGFSATHISEIERGKTSPTIGALVRIAGALGKEPSFFLEEEQLSEVALVRADHRPGIPADLVQTEGEYLTPGIPGGRLNAYMLRLEPDGKPVYQSHAGEEGAFVVRGQVEAVIGDVVHRLGPGDALHYASDQRHGFRNLGRDTAELLLVSTKRVRRNGSSSGSTGGRIS